MPSLKSLLHDFAARHHQGLPFQVLLAFPEASLATPGLNYDLSIVFKESSPVLLRYPSGPRQTFGNNIPPPKGIVTIVTTPLLAHHPSHSPA
eukprot:scaffold21_cov368-Prasinococcus_capsulatus_cf.AAC.22